MKVTTDACLFGAWVAEQCHKTIKNLLDIGTGTGLLSLMIAQENDCAIDAVEIDNNAAAEAKENIAASPWKEKISVIEADITKHRSKKYDCIVSNPPFYERDLKGPSDGKNIAHHSKELKLSELVRIIENRLNENGIFFLLLPFKRKNEILQMMNEAGLFLHILVQVYHSPGHPASRIMIKGGINKITAEERNVYIKNDQGEYSSEFVSLLKEYYLYL